MDEPERCDRVALVHEGRLVLEGEPARLLAGAGLHTFEELFLARFDPAAPRPAGAP
jgi:ABC-type Na+ transport system ATPase subunit NatA